MLTSTERQTLFFLKGILFPGKDKHTDIISDWPGILTELQAHAILPLAAEFLLSCASVPPEIKKEVKEETVKAVYHWSRLMEEQKRVLELLQNREISAVVLKGAAAACYYPCPWYRVMGDIDLYVPPQHIEKAFRILLDDGCCLLHPNGAEDPVHIQLVRNGVELELHRKPLDLINEARSIYINSIVEAGAGQMKHHMAASYFIPMLPPLENGLVLLIHLLKHLKGGVGLRQVIDWMLYADKYVDDTFWRQELEPILQKLGIVNITITLTKMCQIYLGLRKGQITWCKNGHRDDCDKLMEYIMQQGNFGRKPALRHSEFVLNNKNMFAFFKKLQSDGRRRWKMSRYPLLGSFAWGYQLYLYIHKAFRTRSLLENVRRDRKAAKRKKKMLEKLELYSFLYKEDK